MIKNRLVLIDAFALIFRAYYGLPPSLTKDGQPIQAAYGFTMALLAAIKNLQPEYLAVGMDMPKPTLRHKEYLEYKAHRPPPPKDLTAQIPYVKEILKVLNVPAYGVEGYEGEDVIATIVAKVKSQKPKAKSETEFIIVTGDMDCLQLVDDNIKVYSMARGTNQAVLYDKAKVMEKYHFKPEQMVDYKALRGDASDNIPGVAGIGEKTATNLIREFGSLKNIYQNIDKISPKLQALLKESKEEAYLSQKLAKIQSNVPLDFNLEGARIRNYNQNEAILLFNQLGFKSLISRLPQAGQSCQDKLF